MYFFSLRENAPRRARGFALATVLWLFGLFTSTLLIGLWGRSVAGDEVTLETSTRAVLESELVNNRVTDWLSDAIEAVGEMSPAEVAEVVAEVEATPEMQAAIDDVVDQAVAAALAPPGTAAEIDLAAAVEPVVPLVAAALEERGVVSNADLVRAAAQNMPGIELSSGDEMTVGGVASRAEGLLTKVVLVGLAGMLLCGAAAVWLNPDRLRQLRALVVRIGVSAVTFAIVIRVGAWAVDPAGGRSPIAAGGAVLLGSNGRVPAAVALGAAVIAAIMSVFLVRRRRPRPVVDVDEGVFPSTGEQPVLVGHG